jgi:hypothetical protein
MYADVGDHNSMAFGTRKWAILVSCLITRTVTPIRCRYIYFMTSKHRHVRTVSSEPLREPAHRKVVPSVFVRSWKEALSDPKKKGSRSMVASAVYYHCSTSEIADLKHIKIVFEKLNQDRLTGQLRIVQIALQKCIGYEGR